MQWFARTSQYPPPGLIYFGEESPAFCGLDLRLFGAKTIHGHGNKLHDKFAQINNAVARTSPHRVGRILKIEEMGRYRSGPFSLHPPCLNRWLNELGPWSPRWSFVLPGFPLLQ